jgi:hypothetical protein
MDPMLAPCSPPSRTLRAGFAGAPQAGHPGPRLRAALPPPGQVGTKGWSCSRTKGWTSSSPQPPALKKEEPVVI